MIVTLLIHINIVFTITMYNSKEFFAVFQQPSVVGRVVVRISELCHCGKEQTPLEP